MVVMNERQVGARCHHASASSIRASRAKQYADQIGKELLHLLMGDADVV